MLETNGVLQTLDLGYWTIESVLTKANYFALQCRGRWNGLLVSADLANSDANAKFLIYPF